MWMPGEGKKMYDLVIRNGTVVTPEGAIKADVGVVGERIAQIGAIDEGLAVRTVDASGCYVLPGGIDPHTHIEEPFMGTTTNDNWVQGTTAAAAGGVTTVIDFAYQVHGETLSDAVKAWHAKADGNAIIDYGFHVVITDLPSSPPAEISELVEAGYTSFKMFMCYPGLALSDDVMLNALERMSASGGLPMFHAENDAIISRLIDQASARGETHPRWVARTRPIIAEIEATGRALALSSVYDNPAYIVHMSSSDAVRLVAAAAAEGRRVIAETCPHYLTLTDELLEQDSWEAAKYTCAPPLRKASERDRLWDVVLDGSISSVGSDHDCFNFLGQKDLGRAAFQDIPLGLPGVETRGPVLFSEAVSKRGMPVERFAEITATNPAKIFGLFPQKGAVAVGSDADLVIYDPAASVTISQTMLHQHVDYTPFEGWELQGYPRMTISRGDVVFEDGRVEGRQGRGRFLARNRPSLLT